ncbi:MAG: helix-turn-helix transcriptional regulator [Firmicutes bacterium]|nr:helix-turn-helix transcriptional regulator [Bacillota bacterium]
MLEIYPELALLSDREIEVFEQLLSDKTLAQIAETLFISHSTVHFHCKNIYRKLGITSRRQFIITYKDLCQ